MRVMSTGRRAKKYERRCRQWTKKIGELMEGVAKTKLPVDVIVLSDHGMAKVQGTGLRWTNIFRMPDASVQFISPGLYAKSEADAERAYEALRGKSEKFEVYRRAQMPAGAAR